MWSRWPLLVMDAVWFIGDCAELRRTGKFRTDSVSPQPLDALRLSGRMFGGTLSQRIMGVLRCSLETKSIPCLLRVCHLVSWRITEYFS